VREDHAPLRGSGAGWYFASVVAVPHR